MPVLRYFVVIGCCLLGLLFAANYFLPQAELPPPTAAVENGGTLASWRRSQQRLDRPQVAAVVYPDVAPMAPTAERLQWERRMTFRRADAPAQEVKPDSVYEAKAEMADVTAAAKLPAKPAAKTSQRPRSVARAERHDRPNYASVYPPASAYPPAPPFGGVRQAQFDRSAGGFFNFRMF